MIATNKNAADKPNNGLARALVAPSNSMKNEYKTANKPGLTASIGPLYAIHQYRKLH